MKTEKLHRKKVSLFLIVVFAVLLSTLTSIRAIADDAGDTAQSIEKSRMTFRNFMTSSDTEAFRNLMKSARGVFICPQVLNGT